VWCQLEGWKETHIGWAVKKREDAFHSTMQDFVNGLVFRDQYKKIYILYRDDRTWESLEQR
jgi:hypothetical protein